MKLRYGGSGFLSIRRAARGAVRSMFHPDYILQGNATPTDANGWINLATNTPMISPFSINVFVIAIKFL
jgi:hypothetical protein